MERAPGIASALTISALLLGAAADRAAAATVSRAAGAGGAELQLATGDSASAVAVRDAPPGSYTVTADPAGPGLAAGDGCEQPEAHRVVCAALGIVRVVARGGAGADTIDLRALTSVPAEIDGGDGGDVLVGGSLVDRIAGGEGDDSIDPGPGADDVDGGAGDDEVNSAAGADDVVGGAGIDTVRFSDTAQPVAVSFDELPNDGTAGAAGNVRASVERVVGTSHDDRLTGGQGAETLDGGGGNDQLVGGDGSDTLIGGDGEDVLTGDDGIADRLLCGADEDRATIDGLDDAAECEQVTLRSSDDDGDGAFTPADCNDNDPRVKPGAVDVPGNGIDENCDRIDTAIVDNDRDGSPAGVDCDDFDPRRRPTASEVLGNGVDEDCDLVDKPLPPGPIPGRFRYRIGSGVVPGGGFYLRLTRLILEDLPSNVKAKVVCSGPGCPFASRAVPVRNGRLVATRLFARARFAMGTRSSIVEVRLTRPGSFGRVDRLVISPPPKRPKWEPFCIKGGKRTTKCKP